MNILLLGATGKTGKELLTLALASGHQVTVLVRDTTKIERVDKNLHIIKGDVTDEKIMRAAMNSNTIVISALGAVSSSLITASTKTIVDSAKSSDIRHIIMLSSFAVKRNQLKRGARTLTGIIMSSVIRDKQEGERLLKKSGLDWTIVHATTLTNGTNQNNVRIIEKNEPAGLRHKISRVNVATWIITEMSNNKFLNRDVMISE